MLEKQFLCVLRGNWIIVCVLILTIFLNPISGQRGNIKGQILSANNQIKLQGANILLLSTNFGSVSDSSGIYIIPNISAGNYSVRANYIGYKQTTRKNISVYAGQTTEINFALEEEVLKGDEITIIAENRMINPEISVSSINLNLKDIKNIPIASIEEAIVLQAGIEPNMTIRGGNVNSTSFILDGINIREGRTNGPITGLSLTSIEQIQIQTSGFDASFGNVRSGIVQVVTKDPPNNYFMGEILFRNNPNQQLNFTGDWDTIYNIGKDLDVSIGGPISQNFGNLRFLFSYRNSELPYIEQTGNNSRKDESFQVKFISNIKSDSNLTLNGFYISQKGI